MRIKTKITISRPSYGDCREAINITIYDELSRIQFFDGEIGLKEFAECLTGLSRVPMEADVRGLEFVGMRKVTEKRVCELPESLGLHRSGAEKWLEENKQEEGWTVSSYLGSQDSRFYQDGKTFARYSVYKYVKPEEPAP